MGLKPLKYHGHWPFLRYFGMDEPASVLFSLVNALPHVFQLKQVTTSFTQTCFQKDDIDKDSKTNGSCNNYYMIIWLNLYPIVSIIAWVCSALYHIRKTDLSTRTDYITALFFLSYCFWLSLRRLMGSKVSVNLVTMTALLMLSLCIYRSWQIYTEFSINFTYHMEICIVISVLHATTWIVWIVMNMKSIHDDRIWLCILNQVWFIGSAMLEIFDFPPFFGIFDAHSLWHLATIPLGFMWYRFWNIDKHAYNVCRDGSIIADNVKSD